MQILVRGGGVIRNPFLLGSHKVTDEQRDLLFALRALGNKSIISEDDWITIMNRANARRKRINEQNAKFEAWHKIEDLNFDLNHPKVYTFSGTGQQKVISTGNEYLDNYVFKDRDDNYIDTHYNYDDAVPFYKTLSKANKVYEKYKTLNNMENPAMLGEVVIKEKQDKYRKPKLINGVPVMPWVNKETLSPPNYGYNIENSRENAAELAPVTIKANDNWLLRILSPYTNPRGIKSSPDKPLKLQGVTISGQKPEAVGDIRGPYEVFGWDDWDDTYHTEIRNRN